MMEICIWCRKAIKADGKRNSNVITRGICQVCADMLKKKYRMSAALNAADIETLINFLAKETPA